MPHHIPNQNMNSVNFIATSIDLITENSVNDLTVLGEKDIGH